MCTRGCGNCAGNLARAGTRDSKEDCTLTHGVSMGGGDRGHHGDANTGIVASWDSGLDLDSSCVSPVLIGDCVDWLCETVERIWRAEHFL